MDFIDAGRIVLPPHLEVLRFTQQPAWLVRTEFDSHAQHRAILTLERFCPTLTEIVFCGYQDVWTRARDVWTRDHFLPRGRFTRGRKLISLVWNAEGTRREA